MDKIIWCERVDFDNMCLPVSEVTNNHIDKQNCSNKYEYENVHYLLCFTLFRNRKIFSESVKIWKSDECPFLSLELFVIFLHHHLARVLLFIFVICDTFFRVISIINTNLDIAIWAAQNLLGWDLIGQRNNIGFTFLLTNIFVYDQQQNRHIHF